MKARSEAKSGREEDASNKTRQRKTSIEVFDELFSIVQGGFSLTSTGFIVYVADAPTSDLRASLIVSLYRPPRRGQRRGRVLIRY